MYEEINIKKSVKKQFDLTGKKALITGGAGFLGFQFAESIAEMGGIPLIVDINENALENVKNRFDNSGIIDYKTYKADITIENNCKDIFDMIWDENNSIDILINSAAITKQGIENTNADFFAPYEETDPDLWDEGIRATLTSIHITCKIIGQKMVKKGKGSIINIASDIGIISPDQRIYQPDEFGYKGVNFNTPAFYPVSKAGVIHLTKFLATYWAKNNIRVNAISPAGVYRNHDPEFVKKLSYCIPMGRMALPDEFKGAIIFLASEASSFITGHNLVIDGGRTIW